MRSMVEGLSCVKEVHTIEPTSSHNQKSRSRITNNRVHPGDSERKTEREDGMDQKEQRVMKFPPTVADDTHWKKMVNLQLEGWVEPETERKTDIIEERHRLEMDAFVEELRLKDEKLEAFNWRFLSVELESRRLQSHIEGLGQDPSHLKEENLKLEASSMEQQSEVISLKDKMASLQLHQLQYQEMNSKSSPKTPDPSHEYAWSNAKVIREREREEELKPLLVRIPTVMESKKEDETPPENKSQGTIPEVIESHEEEIEEVKKEVEMDPDHVVQEYAACPVVLKVITDKLASGKLSLHEKENHPWKMDLHSLGVFYKIKRLNQQLFMLDKLAGTQTSREKRANCDNECQQLKTFFLYVIPLLNKQVSRYQTLQESTNNLCQRMYDNNADSSSRDANIVKTKKEIRKLENFLGEMFHLQRYMVATGQKLIEIQSRMASELAYSSAQDSGIYTGFNMKRFANSISTLFREVQKGLEARISRMIGELEGTLTCDGFIHLGQ
ncbi:hypothetical protein C5167_015354 [Papaver somniferum]|uniref:Uncharacterized protein n=1 Tax=Papaver somniferum TaxID=3469 RepID=A0A4Y7J996_PAPSO|nr:hypothetical protein C5167_015354 [Papaver somniferum]